MKIVRKIITYIFLGLIALLLILLLLTIKEKPEKILYGSSFNTPYAQELGLNVREVYIAILDDLGVRRLRLAAHWTMIEPTKDEFDFIVNVGNKLW